MFYINGVARSASYVARQIHLIWVEDAAKEFFKPEDLDLPEDKRNSFVSKIYLFCEAAALRVLLTERQNDQRYEKLLREFERLIFPLQPTPEAMDKLETIKFAMKELDRLFTEKKELAWCRQWLQGIGRDETNPETLFEFAQLIGINTSSLRQLVRDIGPP
jgi:hypothetical protein